MSGENRTADGRRIVGLFVPFETSGRMIQEVTFQPSTMGILLRWQDGMIPGAIALLQELTGLDRIQVENIRHPDDQRVMAAFLDHIQPTIAEDIRNGVRPNPGPAPADFAPGQVAGDWSGGYDLADDPLAPDDRAIDHIPGLDD
jgi:hypothetical protein